MAREQHPDTMAEHHDRNRIAGGNPWSAGCVETRTAGAEGGPGKRAGRDPRTAPRSDHYTKLQGPGLRQFYDLYVMLDIFSRHVVHWEVHRRETGELAEQFMQNSFIANGGIVPGTIHSDNGTSMTSKPVTALLADLDIIKSHSRPKVSNDNPYSEAQFKTLKYCPVFPENFGSLDEAETFCHHFFDYYNHRHYHAGIGLHTPFSVHIGTADAIQDKRAETIRAFRTRNPRRFTQTPALPKIPAVAWINRPDEDATDRTGPDQDEHAA
ncbi:transposase [Spirillospora sp. NPDC048823]|uniref:transposase n=1 Tax=unclassified Spirillospora TaxID=2642701 RepID=UPI00371A43E0